MKKLAVAILTTGFISISFAQETKKPFVLEHLLHKHEFHLVNTTVYQQIQNYGAVYNTSHLFGFVDFTETDELFFNASVTFGNGITYKTQQEGYSLSTTADDLEDYLKDINDTGREYLLELFYQKKIGRLTISGGLIDSTAFIDANNYANDEHTQFLNSAFVNNPIAVLPSYNWGGYIHYGLTKNAGISVLYMQNKPDKGNVGIVEVDLEIGNLSLRPYYFYLFNAEENKGFGISGDYTLGDKAGFFFRGGNSNVDYDYFVSGGFQVNNLLFDDYIGFGYGYIKGKAGVEDIKVSEVYYTVNLNNYISFTADIQYMDEIKSDFIYGGRVYLMY
jgi:hypothetical protein